MNAKIWRPHTTILLIAGLVVILVALVGSYVYANFKPTTEVRIAGAVYQLQVADTQASRIQGLSGVDNLKPNGGLLMVFEDDDYHGIWMKDMKIPLDILWLNSDKKVVYVVKNASPELETSQTFTSKDLARYVIELPAGSVEQSGIKVGNIAEFEVGEAES